MSSWTDNPFPNPDGLLEALKIFSQSPNRKETVKDDTGSIDEYKQRQERMMAGWEYRTVPLDPRFVGPSTIKGYHTRQSKIIRNVPRPNLIDRIASASSYFSSPAIREKSAVSLNTGQTTQPGSARRVEVERSGLEQEEEEEDEAAVSPSFRLSTSIPPPNTPEEQKHSESGIERVTGDQVLLVIRIDWYIVYHPTYRIPSLCFTAGYEDGTVLGLQEMLEHRVIRPPSSDLYREPDRNELDLDVDIDSEHLPITSTDSAFPLILREQHPLIDGLLVWTVHPCHVVSHISEVLLDLDEEEQVTGSTPMPRSGGSGREDVPERRARWLRVWMMLHSRILSDL